jgi:hypothetical protein
MVLDPNVNKLHCTSFFFSLRETNILKEALIMAKNYELVKSNTLDIRSFSVVCKCPLIDLTTNKHLSVFSHSINYWSLPALGEHMVSLSFSIIFLVLTNILIEPVTCVLPTHLQDFELIDVSSLRREFPSIIGKIRFIGMFLKIMCNLRI